MKSTTIFFISSSSYYGRLASIIDNHSSGLLDFNFTVVASELGHIYNYTFDELNSSKWWKMLPSIYLGLRDNLQLLSPTSVIPPSFPLDLDDQKLLPKWLHPRKLSFGDLSVISKHHQALELFLHSSDDYALICEDDVIFAEASLKAIHDLAQGLCFDFIDIAGGDGLITKSVDLVVNDRFHLEQKFNLSTRTACCYLISRRYAEALTTVLQSPVFPIDWSMSFAFTLIPSNPLVYWLRNSLAEHGSSTGKVISWRSST